MTTTTTTKWNKMKYFFSTPSKYPGIANEIDRFKAYENASSNVERLNIIFHLPVVQVLICNSIPTRALCLNKFDWYWKNRALKYFSKNLTTGYISEPREGCRFETWRYCEWRKKWEWFEAMARIRKSIIQSRKWQKGRADV